MLLEYEQYAKPQSAALHQCPFFFPPVPLLPSPREYAPAPIKTMHAPNSTPGDNSFPNSHMLANKLTNFRKLSTIVTPSADVRAPRRLTPRMQAYCVRLFRRSETRCVGIDMIACFCDGSNPTGTLLQSSGKSSDCRCSE